MPPTVEITPLRAATVAREPVLVRVVVRNDTAAPVTVPAEPRASDALVWEARADDGTVSRGDGYDRRRAVGGAPRRLDPAGLPTAALAPGEALTWQDDLLDYVDLSARGGFVVRARLRHGPTGVDVLSDPAVIRVEPNATAWSHVARGAATTDLTCHVETCAGDGAPTLVSFCRTTAPVVAWRRARLELPTGARPRVSETDFTTLESFEHDAVRWLVWAAGGALHGLRVRDDGAHEPAASAPVTALADLVGTPTQRPDGGVVTWTLSAAEGLVERHHDRSFAVREAQPLVAIDPRSRVDVCRDAEGRTIAVWAERERLPVHLAACRGAAGIFRVSLGAPDLAPDAPDGAMVARVVGVAAPAGVAWAPVRAALAVVQAAWSRDDDSLVRCLLAVRVPLLGDAAGPAAVLRVSLDALTGSEAIVSAVVAQTTRAAPAVAVVTSGGRVLVSVGGEGLREVVTLADARARVALVAGARGDLWLSYPTALDGVAHRLVYDVPAK